MRTHVFSSYVAAAPAQVWNALTTPTQTPRFYFGLRAESDWAEGSTVVFGACGMQVATGEVVRVEPQRLLMHSLADVCDGALASDRPDSRPATWVAWELEPREDGVTHVRLLVDELESGASDEADETELVWSRLLGNLKTLLETGTGLPRQRGAVLPEAG